MSNQETVAVLLDLAIDAERAAEALYRGLAVKFEHHPDVAQFWREYAQEEVMHADWICRVRASLDEDRLAAPADPKMLRYAHQALERSVEETLHQIGDLEDAYQLAHELEDAETNAIFEFLITHFADDRKTAGFLRAQLKDHVGKLMIDFPIQFPHGEGRRVIKAR
jgi:rubrerythrin